MPRTKQLFADDLAVGFVFRGEAAALTSEHFSQFAALTGDKHPIHYDAAFAAKTKFGRPVAHGLLLTAMTALGATSFSEALEDAMVALVEQQMRFLHPAFRGRRTNARVRSGLKQTVHGRPYRDCRIFSRTLESSRQADIERPARLFVAPQSEV